MNGVDVEKGSKNVSRETFGPNDLDPHIADVQDRLEDKYSTEVRIKSGATSGRIEIEFYGLEDLNRILEIML